MGLKSYFGAHEHVAVGVICFIMLTIGAFLILGSMKPFGTAYENIDVSYTEQGDNLLIHETFLTRISSMDSFNVIYRSFGETICLSTTGSQVGTNSNCNIIIQDVSCSKGTPYLSSYDANPVNMLTRQSFKPTYASKIQSREIGCYSDKVFSNEKATMSVTYLVPKKHVALNMNKHILFSKEHFAINKLNVQALQQSNTQTYLPKDKEVSILVTTGELKTTGVPYGTQAIIWIILSLIPFLLWNIFGKEKQFTVPQYSHVLPNKTTPPWQVDLLINGKNELSKNGMASILMELYTANIVVIEMVKKTFNKTYEFHIDTSIATTTISAKAKKFLDHLLDHEIRKEGKKTVCVLPTNKTSILGSMSEQAFMQAFFKSGDVRQFIDATFDKKGSYAMVAYVVVLVLVSLAFGYIGPGAIYPFIIGLIILIGILPKSLFARFKEDKYKEYLEWHAFNNMLQDYAKIQQYLKEDKHMWKEWLTYAAAMGSAEKLLKSMKELNILSPADYDRTHNMYTHFIAYSLISQSFANPKSSGAGGIGGGGGFGGGGGGGR